MNDKKEDKKTKAKNEEAKEENQSENGETKTNEVHTLGKHTFLLQSVFFFFLIYFCTCVVNRLVNVGK